MMRINVCSRHETVVFAAEELKKYLRMMMPEGGEIDLCFGGVGEGFSVGLMEAFGLDDSDVADPELDEILYAKTQGVCGIIAGNNPRATLLAVYEYLRRNGCRWLMPGKDGEYIPLKSPCDVSFRHKPSRRYRGWCNEGATSQNALLDMIDFTPKVGMNVCMLQFRVPAVFYERYYGHTHNEENRTPEGVTREQVIQWTRECEAEISRRSLQLHSVGHGFTIDPFGIDSANTWSKLSDDEIPEETRQYLALVGGRRGLFGDIPANTNFCMSNAVARGMVAEYIASYAERHRNSDYLHVWLADDYNNHCECEECRKKTPSDWYMILMNDIDRALAERKLSTRIVFIAYVNTCWAPLAERIRNSDRFTLLLAPITRSYTRTLDAPVLTSKTVPYVENGIRMPATLDEYLAYFEDWKKTWSGANLCYEYHFWRHRIYDPSGLSLAKRICEDAEVYASFGVDGLIQCGSQRSFFPNGFAYYVHARKLFDLSLSYDALLSEYFSVAYGQDADAARAYFEEIEACFDVRFTEGERSEDPTRSRYYRPSEAEKLLRTHTVAERGRAALASFSPQTRLQSASARLLRLHTEYAEHLADFFACKAKGDGQGAIEKMHEMKRSFGAREESIEAYYDQFLLMDALLQIAYENDHGF